ncbi:pyrroline-5-carboxylate reductase [Natronogracilivirga saccharolytica]|uniref:Pyrroline-5-carboxylate reductase n=1 Tax=Natronogracilivirga saccharolytica TaxID=2812953 RepID=A0A8J7RKS5_9BACT|nr:pyrroline-5-carboxylate reductase [Natronogracilivirga saccharolytica]MBP3192645.1 pyrroline-5-carboxylate reductase [Natronogracilivirga saccharolytica]
MLKDKKITIIGAGKMGETLASRFLSTGTLSRDQLFITAKHESRVAYFDEKFGIKGSTDNAAAVKNADIILLCVKPQIAPKVIELIRESINQDQLVISIMAGYTLEQLQKALVLPLPVIRAMPNTPSEIGAGMTVLASGNQTNGDHIAFAKALFDTVGETTVLDEKYFDAVTGLSASGPAFIYMVIEALAEGGVKCGLPRDVSTTLVTQACLGAARMVAETGQHPAILKDHVTTPAGCTIDGLLKLEEGGLRVTMIKAVDEAARRAKELGGE